MADRHTREQRSYNMSRIRSTETKPELKIKRFMGVLGFSYQPKGIAGKPDFANMKKKIKLFDAFTGYGGASWGFKKAKIPVEIVGFSEVDKTAEKFYLLHFKGIKNYGDITKIEPEKLPDFDFFTGGFPCQSFSSAGKFSSFINLLLLNINNCHLPSVPALPLTSLPPLMVYVLPFLSITSILFTPF